MSSPCAIHFQDPRHEAVVYRHLGGYPEALIPDLEAFFDAVLDQAPDGTRFGDAPYLAARFIVWQSRRDADKPNRRPLDFVGVGVGDAHDVDYRYTVRCNGRRPVIELFGVAVRSGA